MHPRDPPAPAHSCFASGSCNVRAWRSGSKQIDNLSEIGVVAAQGARNAYGLKWWLAEGINEHGEVVVPDGVCAALKALAEQIDAFDEEIGAIDEEIGAAVKADERARRLTPIPGIGPVTASAIVSTVPDMRVFSNRREFAAFLGLTTRQRSSGGKERFGRTTKMGDRYLRKLLVVGATAVLRHAKGHSDALRRWARSMLEHKTVKYAFKLIAVALANKLARIVFALLRSGWVYDDRPAAA